MLLWKLMILIEKMDWIHRESWSTLYTFLSWLWLKPSTASPMMWMNSPGHLEHGPNVSGHSPLRLSDSSRVEMTW